MNLKFKQIENKIISTYKYKTDEEILEEIIGYSNDKYLPRESHIQKLNSTLYYEFLKRYGNFSNMAIKFGLLDKLRIKPFRYWTEDKVKEIYMNVHNKYGVFISKDEAKCYKYKCELCEQLVLIWDRMSKFGGILILKLNCLNDNIDKINNYDLLWLNQVSNNQLKVTPEQQQLAQQILDKYNSKLTQS